MKFKFLIFAVKSATRMTQNLILFFLFLMTNNLPRKLHVASTTQNLIENFLLENSLSSTHVWTKTLNKVWKN